MHKNLSALGSGLEPIFFNPLEIMFSKEAGAPGKGLCHYVPWPDSSLIFSWL